jgi:hypothetical protein
VVQPLKRSGNLLSAVILVLMIILLTAPSVIAQDIRMSNVYNDKEEDVLADSKKGPLDRLMDLKNLDDKADVFQERNNVDISSLTIISDGTHFYFIITVEGEVRSDSNYTYFVCGYTRNDPKESETFDFIISHSGGETSYVTWVEGKYVQGANISSIKFEGATLNLTIHRDHFILGSSTEPYLVCAVIVMYPGEGQDRYIDYVTTVGEEKGSEFDSSTWMIIQVVFIGILVITMLILWNFWAKKREVEQEGGVCPKCEARLDKNLDFCPHCGTFIRGPEADKENPKPRIVHPLDIENEE